jgi:hypothetical protein
MFSTKPLATAMLAIAAVSSLSNYGVDGQAVTAAFFQPAGYGGQSFSYGTTIDQCISIPCFDKKISSMRLVYNAPSSSSGEVQTIFFASANCTGGTLLSRALAPGQQIRIESLTKGANDMISSFRFVGLRPTLTGAPFNVCPYIRPTCSTV